MSLSVATIRPFSALRPPQQLAPQVAAPPYDVVTTVEARALAAGNPDSFLHISRPEIDLPEGTDEHDDAVYAQGKKNLEAMLGRGLLVREARPHLYLYAQHMGSHRQMGVVACAAVQDYLNNTIKRHEKTRPDKEDDRTRHIDTLRAHDEPVFLTYRAVAAIDALVSRVTAAGPTYDFVTQDGVRHVLWVVPQPETEQLVRLFGEVTTLFVADGHHRSAAAARVHALRRGQPGEHDVFLAVLFPHDQMQILAYNRVVRDTLKRSPDELLVLFRESFWLEETSTAIPDRTRCFTLFLGGRWYRLTVRPETVNLSDPVASLDASICQDRILAPLFNIHDPRTDRNVGFVGGIRGSGELERLVNSGEWDLGLHLFPTSIDQLIAVSQADRLMPPKSTWFEPKLRSGLFLHMF
jgi:uncharacterized protein (DUF1015 family)